MTKKYLSASEHRCHTVEAGIVFGLKKPKKTGEVPGDIKNIRKDAAGAFEIYMRGIMR